MLKQRLITGPLLSIALIAMLYFDNQIGSIACECGTTFPQGLLLAILAACLAPIVAIEFGSIAHGAGIRASIPVLILTIEAWIVSIYLVGNTTDVSQVMAIFGTIFIASFALSMFMLAKSRDLKGVLGGAAFTTATSSYVAIAIGFLLLIRREHDAMWILGIISIVKMCDTGAFFVGCNFGKHKLIPWISPGKTWEGLIGGIVTASLTAMLLSKLNNAYLPDEPTISMSSAALFGAIFGLLGQAGDLIMSICKRDSGIKDSSSVLPGLGGLLDVLDSLLLVSPVAYWLLLSA